MKYEAVIFDLGGTLVRSATWSDWTDAARKTARMVGAPPDDFIRLWFEQVEGLGTGRFANYQALIKSVCSQLHMPVKDSQVESAARIPYDITKQMITTPRDDALFVINRLKQSNYRIGLITDCAPDVPEIWGQTPFAELIDVALFSCSVGMNKTDPRIFELAATQLAVRPERCIYVADGNRQELANAKKHGMYAIRILIPEEIDESPIREQWTGPTVSSLTEVLEHLSAK